MQLGCACNAGVVSWGHALHSPFLYWGFHTPYKHGEVHMRTEYGVICTYRQYGARRRPLPFCSHCSQSGVIGFNLQYFVPVVNIF